MKNKCIYTKEVIKEYHYAALLFYFKKLIVTLLVIFVFALLNFIVKLITHNVDIHSISFLIFSPILLLAMILKENKGIKREEERFLVIYGKKYTESIVELCDVIRVMGENRNQQEVSYDHVVAYRETKNLIIIILDGRMFVPLSKKGFINGDAESCKKLLNSKIK